MVWFDQQPQSGVDASWARCYVSFWQASVGSLVMTRRSGSQRTYPCYELVTEETGTVPFHVLPPIFDQVRRRAQLHHHFFGPSLQRNMQSGRIRTRMLLEESRYKSRGVGMRMLVCSYAE